MPAESPEDCIFCKIVRREEPAGIVAEDDTTIAFLDIVPINPGHTLVVPKAHAGNLEDMPAATGRKVFEMALRVASALRRSGLRCEGANLHLADRRAAGQEVDHVHLHVIPRFAGDGHRIRPGPSYGHLMDPADRDAIASKIRAAIRPSAAD